MLTADWIAEHIKSRKARVVVDSGTQDGIHVPLGVFRNIIGECADSLYSVSMKDCGESVRVVVELHRQGSCERHLVIYRCLESSKKDPSWDSDNVNGPR
jgi:hypothetical protein